MKRDFTFKYFQNGNPKGFFSSKGQVLDDGLKLGDEFVPYSCVCDSTTRDERLVLVLDTRDPNITPTLRANMMENALVLAVNGSLAESLERYIDRFASKHEAEQNRIRLEEAGEGHLFRVVTCPHCEATVDLSGVEKAPYIYCRYCESLFGDGVESLQGAADYRTCDDCGYHDRVRGYGEFYFYFLLVIYGFSHKRRHLCDACAKSLANKLLLINSIFVLGVPNAIYCMIRSRSGKDQRMKGLALGNQMARGKKMDKAEVHYRKSLDIFRNHPGIHFNRAMGYLSASRGQEGVQALMDALKACPNYLPAQRLQLELARAVERSQAG